MEPYSTVPAATEVYEDCFKAYALLGKVTCHDKCKGAASSGWCQSVRHLPDVGGGWGAAGSSYHVLSSSTEASAVCLLFPPLRR